MIISVIPIGNSKGIRLPKAILDQLQISDKLELEIEDQHIVLTPVSDSPRRGWRDAFREMHTKGEDSILLPEDDEPEAFEWEW